MTDLERLLIASHEMLRLKDELKLSAQAIAALRDTLQARDNTIALLEARLRLMHLRLQRRSDNDLAEVIDERKNWPSLLRPQA